MFSSPFCGPVLGCLWPCRAQGASAGKTLGHPRNHLPPASGPERAGHLLKVTHLGEKKVSQFFHWPFPVEIASCSDRKAPHLFPEILSAAAPPRAAEPVSPPAAGPPGGPPLPYLPPPRHTGSSGREQECGGKGCGLAGCCPPHRPALLPGAAWRPGPISACIMDASFPLPGHHQPILLNGHESRRIPALCS